MKIITKPGDNLGGLVKMWAIPRSVVSVSGRTVVLASTTDIYEIYCTPGSLLMAEPHERGNEGVRYNVEISGFIPYDSDTVRTAIEEMESKPYAVLFKDGNSQYKLSGGEGGALRLSSVLNTGKDTFERAGYEIKFAGITTKRAVFVDYPFA